MNVISFSKRIIYLKQYRFVIAVLVLLVRGLSGLIWIAPSPLLPVIMTELNVSRGAASWLVSLPAVVMVILSIPIGLIIAKIGLKKSFTLGALLQGAGLLTLICSNFALLLLTRWIYAVGATFTFSTAGGLIARWFNRKERPLLNGFNMALTSLGSAIALFASVPLATIISWRGALAFYGGLALASCIAWQLLGREHPKTDNSATYSSEPLQEHQTQLLRQSTIRWLLKKRSAWLLAFGLLGINCLLMAMSSWLPTYYYEVFKIPLAQAGATVSVISLTGIAASIVGGFLPVWLGKRKPVIIVTGLLVSLIGLSCFLFNNWLVIIISIVLFGFLIRLAQPSVWTVTMELPEVTPQFVPTMISFVLAWSSIGGFLGPSIVGYTNDITGSYLPGLIISCILSLSLFFCGFLLPETGPKGKK